MSDAVQKPRKVSREGVVLIKAFEGFRPKAVRRADGRWVIGYGHTLSAREGATVSEQDAELLLQYDLLAVTKAMSAVAVPLNQHQFDALASFAFSIGADRFAASDVLARLNAGRESEAADALLAASDTPTLEAPARRRAAEHALFLAAPDTPTALVDLLAAPLSSPAPFAEPPVGGGAWIETGLRTPLPPWAGKPAALHLYSPYALRSIGPIVGLPSAAPAHDPAAAASLGTSTDAMDIEAVSTPGPLTAANDQEAPASVANAGTEPTPDESVASPSSEPDAVASASGAPDQHPLFASPLNADSGAFATTPPDGTDTDSEAQTDLDAAADQIDEGQALLFESRGVADDPLSVRYGLDARPASRFSWSEIGTSVVMGGIGLVSFGAAMAAFRRASTGGDTAIIGGVLALIALVCVGVSGFNLYQRWGATDRD